VLFAEPLFGVLLAVTIILADSATEERSAWLAGIAAALALLTRSIGIAVVAGAVCLLLMRRAPWRMWAGTAHPHARGSRRWSGWVAMHARGIDPALALVYGTVPRAAQPGRPFGDCRQYP